MENVCVLHTKDVKIVHLDITEAVNSMCTSASVA